MNTINLPSEECRRGAIAAFQTLLKLDANAEDRNNCGDEAGDFFAWRFKAATALADALGPMPDFLRGAIMAMGEWIHFQNSTGTPNEHWQPVAAMTEAELQGEIAQMEADLAEGLARENCNVAQLRC
jgi:hypothetical protein